jgi:hypothetical protein
MGNPKWSPEEREEFLRLRDETMRSRQQLQQAWDNLHEKWRLADERRDRRRRMWRRLLPFRRAA